MLIGFLGPDWLRKHGLKGDISEDMLRSWRDYLESAIQSQLRIEADFALGPRTHFAFTGGSDTHTVVEIEAIARRALDAFLDKKMREL